jgi:hypothetical protein
VQAAVTFTGKLSNLTIVATSSTASTMTSPLKTTTVARAFGALASRTSSHRCGSCEHIQQQLARRTRRQRRQRGRRLERQLSGDSQQHHSDDGVHAPSWYVCRDGTDVHICRGKSTGVTMPLEVLGALGVMRWAQRWEECKAEGATRMDEYMRHVARDYEGHLGADALRRFSGCGA